MRPFISTDEDGIEDYEKRPVDLYDGYLGTIEMGDENYFFDTELDFMNEVEWGSYARDQVDDEGGRTFTIEVGQQSIVFNIDWDDFVLADLLDQLPAIDMQTSDAWWIVFLRDGYTESQAVEQVKLLVKGLGLEA